MLEAIIFYTLSFLAALAGVGVVTQRNPVGSAVSLVACFFCLAGVYAMLDAHFVAVAQVLVYAGAIMVLFVFVIMVLNLREDGMAAIPGMGLRALAGLAVAGLVGTGLVVSLEVLRGAGFTAPAGNSGTIKAVGGALFGGTYLLPFELASAVLTVAMIGAVVLARREV